MICCHDPAFLYFAPPKTATRSIVAALATKFDLMYIGGGKHTSDVEPQHRGYYAFITIRNPFSRAVSVYWHIRTRVMFWPSEYRKQLWEMASSMSFSQWIRDPRIAEWNAMHDMVYPYLTAMPRRDRIIRYENLREDFENLPFVNDETKLPHLNRSPSDSPWYSNYDGKAVDAVKRRWHADFEALGYSQVFDAAITEEVKIEDVAV